LELRRDKVVAASKNRSGRFSLHVFLFHANLLLLLALLVPLVLLLVLLVLLLGGLCRHTPLLLLVLVVVSAAKPIRFHLCMAIFPKPPASLAF
jgi:hypothetical protein